ncbi:unnamed protein product, partial [Effrenium voratum]
VPNAILFGTGEYTTGLTPSGQAKSDKSLGVVALTFFDLRERGKIGERIGMVGTNAEKEPKINEHFRQNLTFTNIGSKEFEFFPKAGKNPKAYQDAIKAFQPGDLCTVFTPDDTHFEICKAALEGGLHVLVTKPMVKTLAQHKELVSIARAKGVLLQIEVHKRFDPIYNDARQRIQTLGNFGPADKLQGAFERRRAMQPLGKKKQHSAPCSWLRLKDLIRESKEAISALNLEKA